MNIIIKDIINKPQVINYFDSIFHDESYDSISHGFDKERKEFFVNVSWADLEHATKQKLLKVFTYYSCPLITVKIIINNINQYVMETDNIGSVDYFLDWRLEDDLLTIKGVLKNHKLWLASESEIHLFSITEIDWNRIVYMREKKFQRIKSMEKKQDWSFNFKVGNLSKP